MWQVCCIGAQVRRGTPASCNRAPRRRASTSSAMDPSPLGTASDTAAPAAPPNGAATYVEYVMSALAREAPELGRAWSRRGAASLGAARPGSGGDASDDAGPAEELVRAMLGAAGGGHWHEQVMRTGWTSGSRAFWRGAALYQLLKELDGGVTLLLSAADAATREFEGAATASDGLALARRLSEAASLLRLAAAGGYSRAMADELRQRYRTIRHDLRNPLGTITTAMAMMDDESLPAEMRQNPRVRAMVARNARSMEEMIASTLGDAAASLPAVAVQTTSLRDLACAVRGDLSAAAEGIEVVVGRDLPSCALDSTGLELLLKAIVLAVGRRCAGRAEVAIDLERSTGRGVVIAIAPTVPVAATEPLDLAFARDLMARLGGRLAMDGEERVLVEIPVPSPAPDAHRERVVEREGGAIPPRGDASAADERHDVAGEGERPNGESRPL